MVRASIADGWTTFRRHARLLVGATIVTTTLVVLIDVGYYGLMTPDQPALPFAEALRDMGWMRAGGWPAIWLGIRNHTRIAELWRVVASLLLLPVFLAVPYMQLELVRGGSDAGVVALIQGFRRYVPLVGLTLLTGVLNSVLILGLFLAGGVVGGGLAMLMIAPFGDDPPQLVLLAGWTLIAAAIVVPAFYVFVGFIYAPLLVLDQGLGSSEALNGSWAMSSGYRLPALALGLACLGILAVGVLAFGIGLAVAIPVTGTAFAAFYNRVLAANPPPQLVARAES